MHLSCLMIGHSNTDYRKLINIFGQYIDYILSNLIDNIQK
jgi:hypothetical protein